MGLTSAPLQNSTVPRAHQTNDTIRQELQCLNIRGWLEGMINEKVWQTDRRVHLLRGFLEVTFLCKCYAVACTAC
jgi:hypothetical protein